MLLPVTSKIDEKGMLNIGGISVARLKEMYGTPLYIMDIATIKKQCADYMKSFGSRGLEAEVIFASKAFASIASCQLIAREGLSIDVSTGGELYIALESGFEPKKIYFHGNNKSEQEISYGLDTGVGCFIVDNFEELELLARLAEKKGKKQRIFLRITPGIEASTHKYIQTGKTESKFGFGIGAPASEAVKDSLSYKSLELAGIHSHIGSQIFNLASYERLIDVLLKFLRTINSRMGADISEINIGGGLGIQYTNQDRPPSVSHFSDVIHEAVKKYSKKHQKNIEKIYLEPGRSIVGNAGITLYEAGAIKEIPHVKNYISVDGGMSDNIRPILYQAKYEPFMADRMNEEGPGKVYTIVGKHCESGDILVEDAHLPIVNKGDLIAIAATGAYCYAMASNYNGQPKHPVVAVEDSKSWIWIEGEQYPDLISGNRKLYED